MKPIPCYLLLDREDPNNPRWVIAQAVLSVPAEVPDDLTGPGTAWLSTFGHDQFSWLADNLHYEAGVRIPQEGREGFATRLVPWDRRHLEHDKWGLGWFEGWDVREVDTWVDPDDRDVEPAEPGAVWDEGLYGDWDQAGNDD